MDYHFPFIILALMIFVLLSGLKITYTQGIDHQQSIKSFNSETSLNTKQPVSAPKQLSTFNISSNNASKLDSNSINQNPWLPVVQFFRGPVAQFTVSGLAAGIALFIGNIALDRYRRPHLLVDKKAFLQTAFVDLTLYEIDIPGFSRELRDFKVQYVVNRVIIKNDGKSAADQCKGVLKINNKEEKICWYVPSERYKMTINLDSNEYLEVCAVLCGEASEIFKQLEKRIELFGGGKNGGAEARKYIQNMYQTYEDIPVIIAPTENGWQPAKFNRKIEPGLPATVIVTAKNARPSLKLDIKILDKPVDNGRIIELR